MADESKEWQDRVKGLLKAELAKRNINYQQLSALLDEKYGITESPQNLSNKGSQGEVFGCVYGSGVRGYRLQVITSELGKRWIQG